MLTPFPTQLSGAAFLADRQAALLADEPRVGKTGAAIIGGDYSFAETILVVTTASGRPVWRRAFDAWSGYGRTVQVMEKAAPVKAQVVIVGWPSVNRPEVLAVLLKRRWDLLVLDESHNAKNFEAKRTEAVYGRLVDDGATLVDAAALAKRARQVWCLSGTPMPNSPADLYPMLRAIAWERLGPPYGPVVMKSQDFLHRYCIVRMKKLPRGFRKIPIVVGGRNLEELRDRLDGFILRRTQADVGIREPIYETLPLATSAKVREQAFAGVDTKRVLEAAEAGDTRKLDMELGPVRRLTGEIKARAVVEALHDEFDSGVHKIVLAYWHRDAGAILREGLAKFGVSGIDGSTPAAARGEAEQRFLHDPKIRVFLGQIQAAGEAIDLSAAAEMWFVETSLVPKDMAQMSKRITNFSQKRQCFVRVCVLEGSIDEALEQVLLRKWTAIRKVID